MERGREREKLDREIEGEGCRKLLVPDYNPSAVNVYC